MASRYEQTRLWRNANRERFNARQRAYRAERRALVNEYARQYQAGRRTDPIERLRNNMRNRLRKALVKEHGRTFELVGCGIPELKAHLEAQFTNGMTWDNYGSWHVDHRIPLASATSIADVWRLCHYTNLQPLWAADNIRKGISV